MSKWERERKRESLFFVFIYLNTPEVVICFSPDLCCRLSIGKPSQRPVVPPTCVRNMFFRTSSIRERISGSVCSTAVEHTPPEQKLSRSWVQFPPGCWAFFFSFYPWLRGLCIQWWLLRYPDEPPKHYISIRNLRMHNNQVLENRTTCQNILFCCEHKRVIELILLGSTWHQSIKFCPLSGSSQMCGCSDNRYSDSSLGTSAYVTKSKSVERKIKKAEGKLVKKRTRDTDWQAPAEGRGTRVGEGVGRLEWRERGR